MGTLSATAPAPAPVRVAFLHTLAGVRDGYVERLKSVPEIQAGHLLDESLLSDLLAGAGRAEVYARLSGRVEQLAADADLVVVTCSSMSPGLALLPTMGGVPVLRGDEPLARAAVAVGTRIGLVCTASSTLEASTDILLGEAKRASREVDVHAQLVREAYDALRAGDHRTHDQLLTARVLEIAERVDVIVLAQASMAHLQPVLAAMIPIPVLAGPGLLVEEVARRARREPASHPRCS